MFRSEIGSGFEDPGGTPPPRIPRSTPPGFWGQFTETIDKAEIAPINKFTYLCGLLGPKVKTTVESKPCRLHQRITIEPSRYY